MDLKILVILLVHHCASQTYDTYDLLSYVKDNSLLDTTTGMDEFNAFQLQETTKISAPLSQIDIWPNLVTPFSVETIFKLEDSRTSYLFSISHGNADVKLAVGFTLVGKDIVRMTLFSDILPNNNVSFIIHDVKDNWQRYLFYVEKNRVSLKVNGCDEFASEDFSESLNDVELPGDARLYIGNSADEGNAFVGAVQEIKLYSNVDVKSFEFICKKEQFELPESEALVGNFAELSPPPLPPPPPLIDEEKSDSCQCSESTVSKIIRTMVDLRGPPGENGSPGSDGIMGNQGLQGERGPIGIQGEKGEKGSDGSEGPEGNDGIKGEAGLQGPPGLPGRDCENETVKKVDDDSRKKGETGPVGPPGPPGANGDIGKKGEPGTKGDKGENGVKGDVGPRGEKGERGESKPGPPGARGGPGDKGSKGDKGEVGPTGLPGSPLKFPDINSDELNKIIDVIKEKIDRNGQQIPRDNSTVTYIKGPPGPRGPSGSPGKKGPRGQKGVTGETGPRGPTGPLGPPGSKGAFGEKGQKGECLVSKELDKIIVSKGEKGERGDIGPQGEKGIPGQNYDGITGLPGPPGPQGIPGLSIMGPKGEPGNFMDTKSFFGINGIVDRMNSRNQETSNDINSEDDWYATGTIIHRSSRSLLKNTPSTPLGTLAYVIEEKMLLIRVEHGWQYVLMGSILDEGRSSQKVKSNFIKSSTYKSSRYTRKDVQSSRRHLYLRMAAVNFPCTGRMNSINTANSNCYEQAQNAGLNGTFAAFLTSQIGDLREIVRRADHDLPVVNTKGEVLFSSWKSIFNGSEGAFHNLSPIYSFEGRNVFSDPLWPNKIVWHGGSSVGQRSTNAFCDEWQSDSPKYYGVASSLMSYKLLGQDMYTCDSEHIVLCIEVTSNESRRRRRHKLYV